MRFLDTIFQAVWRRLAATPPAACCPGCCIHFANFR